MRWILSFLAVIAVGFSVTTACSKKHVPNASLYGKWELVSSTSPYVANIPITPPGSVLNLGADGKYEITAQGAVKDTGTFFFLRDSVSGSNILYFNNGQYFANGVNGKAAYSMSVQGENLQLGFISLTLEFITAPVILFKKL